MLTQRELKELVQTPAFYILMSVFLAVVGFRYYSLLVSYIDLSGIYPDYIVGMESKELSGIDINKYIFPKLFSFYSYLVVMLVPVLSSGLGQERMSDIDKVELLSGYATEGTLILRRVFFICSVFGLMLIPTLLFPFLTSLFTSVDWGLVVVSYIGLLVLITLLAFVSMPIGLLKINFVIVVFLNFVLGLGFYVYFIEPVFVSFWFGVLRFSIILFALLLSFAFYRLAKRVYISTRIYE